MIILNDPFSDSSEEKLLSGSYEWWYFDAISRNGEDSLVVIFYEGNPFSRRYIEALEDHQHPVAEDYPAISLSIYHKSKPVYYSFIEYSKNEFTVTEEPLSIGTDTLSFTRSLHGNDLDYHLRIDQKLDSGFTVKADLHFLSQPGKEGKIFPPTLAHPSTMETGMVTMDKHHMRDHHKWNLVQPRARVFGSIQLNRKKKRFEGLGYHDHNVGYEPMKESFKEWYWGRFHFQSSTLIYYLMVNHDQSTDFKAWLYDSEYESEQSHINVHVDSFQGLSSNLFGLNSFSEIHLKREDLSIKVSQKKAVDSGPFYKRWIAEATLLYKDGKIERSKGVTEFIQPERIYERRYWPLVNMRIRYMTEKPHWVQQSRVLYPWTW